MDAGHAELLSPMGTVVGSPERAAEIGKKREDAVTKAILAATAEDRLYTDFTADAKRHGQGLCAAARGREQPPLRAGPCWYRATC